MSRKHVLWVVGICLLTLLTVVAGWQELWGAIQRGNPIVLGGLCLVQLLTLGVIAYQWQYLFGRADVPLGFRRVFEVTLAGLFVESTTPTSKLGGMAAKLYLFDRTTETNYRTASSVLLAQKYVSLPPLALLCVGSASVGAASLESEAISSAVYGLVAGFVGLVVGLTVVLAASRREPTRDVRSLTAVALPDSVTSVVDRGLETLESTVAEAGVLLDRRGRYWLYSLSFLLWIVYPLKIYAVAYTLGIETTLTIAFVGTYLAYIVSLAPVSPGGVGTFEGMLAVVFLAGGIPFADGLSVAVLSRVVTFWVPLGLSALVTAVLVCDEDGVVSEDDGVVSRVATLVDRVRR
ncbi:lysylphosphatidylglycerol synthase transmembrane domain-containing protein [Natronobacterium gregoryi]|uniref:TIGR00374 family protein n=2 Tax=Natronobacterium gregoryi TaxID=44930 RepID=L0AH18_NATGS|nr:lysylphosphatidylglycerol synthase transmembrane domain-containing protein [Natronobacterium gregoryi]AFZ73183.1 hypothetical protein Natgr_2000 [Natronobacterium gregoryi SP2]ELY71360.1 hypothetical protein C490_05497 [Natronobacterium gregoryi SP2]PLK21593.1 TIGR00374 family protein [Natronobacterium gregoryi SP2]SFI59170.1 hypothetical protein SAMN05443661_10281 [Natronobacterium gregoryi]